MVLILYNFVNIYLFERTNFSQLAKYKVIDGAKETTSKQEKFTNCLYTILELKVLVLEH